MLGSRGRWGNETNLAMRGTTEAGGVDWRELRLTNISKRFDSAPTGSPAVIEGIDLCIQAGGFYCLLGPSGCGKTTLLNIIAGFEQPTSGTVTFDERPIEGPGTNRAVIFQDISNALFPWLTARENVEFGLRMRGVPRNERHEKAHEHLALVGLSQHGDKFPYELSGGMKQRAQIARALVNEPDVLLMDEPFAALDAITKRSLQRELLRIWTETRKTIFYITHDITEAIFLGTTLGVMSSGPQARILREFDLTSLHPKDPSEPAFIQLAQEAEGLIEGQAAGRSQDLETPA
jgi:NitT/TauT family transport system ATP-binding protein